MIASFYFYVCFSVYFTFSTIAMSLLLSHDLHVRLLRVVQYIGFLTHTHTHTHTRAHTHTRLTALFPGLPG